MDYPNKGKVRKHIEQLTKQTFYQNLQHVIKTLFQSLYLSLQYRLTVQKVSIFLEPFSHCPSGDNPILQFAGPEDVKRKCSHPALCHQCPDNNWSESK